MVGSSTMRRKPVESMSEIASAIVRQPGSFVGDGHPQLVVSSRNSSWPFPILLGHA